MGGGVIQFSEFSNKDAIIVVATNEKFHQKITETIQEKFGGTITIIYYSNKLDDELNDGIDEVPLVETRLLSVCVGQACNFKCRDCMNFAPYAKKENMRYPLSKIEQELDLLLANFSCVDKLHIQGGEPFLYSELDSLLLYIEEHYKNIIGKIQIATNGNVLPKPRVLEVLKSVDCDIRISNYPCDNRVDELKTLLDKNEIQYHIYHFGSKNDKWNSSGEIDYIAPLGENTKKKVEDCSWCMCYSLENGIVGRCARSIPALSVQKVPFIKKDYLIVDNNMSRTDVSKYFMFIKPMECCRYCKGSYGESIEPAIQL